MPLVIRSVLGEITKEWLDYESLTLEYNYNTLLKGIINNFSPYKEIVRKYNSIYNNKIKLLYSEFIKENPSIIRRNIALLKNSIELWRAAINTNDSISPILFHYSLHCFTSFFVYTFFVWDPLHAKGHGISPLFNENVMKMKISIHKKGIFQRLIDTWELLGVPSAFSKYIPITRNRKIEFNKNPNYLLSKSNNISIDQIIKFNPEEFRSILYSKNKEHEIKSDFLSNPILTANYNLKNYLLIFAASSIARYRPGLWLSYLSGEDENSTNFIIEYSKALINYTRGVKRSTGLLHYIMKLLESISEGNFTYGNINGKSIIFE